jgi:hypothetical protein
MYSLISLLIHKNLLEKYSGKPKTYSELDVILISVKWIVAIDFLSDYLFIQIRMAKLNLLFRCS